MEGISHRMSNYLCCVLPPSFSLLLSRADLIEFLRTAGKDVSPGKLLVSYLIGCDHGIDKFYFVVHFLKNLFISSKDVSASYTFFTCNKILVINKSSYWVRCCRKHFQTLSTFYI